MPLHSILAHVTHNTALPAAFKEEHCAKNHRSTSKHLTGTLQCEGGLPEGLVAAYLKLQPRVASRRYGLRRRGKRLPRSGDDHATEPPTPSARPSLFVQTSFPKKSALGWFGDLSPANPGRPPNYQAEGSCKFSVAN